MHIQILKNQQHRPIPKILQTNKTTQPAQNPKKTHPTKTLHNPTPTTPPFRKNTHPPKNLRPPKPIHERSPKSPHNHALQTKTRVSNHSGRDITNTGCRKGRPQTNHLHHLPHPNGESIETSIQQGQHTANPRLPNPVPTNPRWKTHTPRQHKTIRHSEICGQKTIHTGQPILLKRKGPTLPINTHNSIPADGMGRQKNPAYGQALNRKIPPQPTPPNRKNHNPNSSRRTRSKNPIPTPHKPIPRHRQVDSLRNGPIPHTHRRKHINQILPKLHANKETTEAKTGRTSESAS